MLPRVIPDQEIELAWAAGFFDGEGHTGLQSKSQKYRYLRLTVGQTEPTTLERFQKAVGYGNITGPYPRKGTRKDVWVWQTTSKKAHEALNRLLPYLSGPKREQARLAIANERLGLYKDRTTCKRGHSFTGDNVYTDKYGYRSCVECRTLGTRPRL